MASLYYLERAIRESRDCSHSQGRVIRVRRSLKGFLLRLLAVRGNVVTGREFHVGPRSRVWAPNNLAIGNYVYIGKNCTVEVDGTIGHGVLIANNVGLVGRRDHDHNQHATYISRAAWVGNDRRLSLPLTIEDDVWVGFGAVILSGVTIGESAIVAAGAVVNHDVPPNAIVSGNPARIVGWRFAQPTLERQRHWLKERRARA